MHLTADINKDNYYLLRYPQVDLLMVKLLWLHFFVVSAYALIIYFIEPARYYPSPLSWKVISLQATAGVIVLGALAALLPALLRGRVRNHFWYRLLVTNCLFVFSYLLVFVTGGSIEAHFHFFIVLALIAMYYDWRLGWVGLVAVAAHHSILNFVAPDWVYFYGRNDVSVLAHALPVIVSVLYLTWITENGRSSINTLRAANKQLEDQLRERVPELQTK
jgi:hypothetical protein